MIKGIHHVGISVLDLEAALEFYSTAQSFELLYRFEVADSPANRAMLQVENAAARAAFMRGTLGCLELFEFAAGGQAACPDRAVYAAGVRHICLQTEISDQLYDGLVAAGASTHARPAGLGTGNSYVYIRDHEGNLIELEGTPWAPAGAERPWFAHVALVTPDIDRLTRFYALLTGIDVHRRGSFGPDPKFDLVAGIPDLRFHGGWLRLANAELEFWQYDQPKTVPVERRSAVAPGWNHLCFESDDIAADHARLTELGVDLHGSPHAFGNAQVFFGRDPDGNIFEVLQPGADASVTVATMLADREGGLVDSARIAFRGGAA
jgi:catechol 2,3-dioxygenase-like lactoylglutathione lyase family enzyme